VVDSIPGSCSLGQAASQGGGIVMPDGSGMTSAVAQVASGLDTTVTAQQD
jgi:hypothetical protein